MGKGGQSSSSPSGIAASANAACVEEAGVWRSPYKPLDKNAPELPSKGEVKASIPKHCFKHSYILSFFYLVRDLAMACALAWVTCQALSTDLPSLTGDPVGLISWLVGWTFYAFWMGTIMTGLWVLAHECGHGGFSESQTVNDIVGFIVHQFLLVPYFAWQYTHAKHHRRTNHVLDGESHVPTSKEEHGLDVKFERRGNFAEWSDEFFAGFYLWASLFMGWPIYLMGLLSTGKLGHDGKPLNGAVADHFRPSSPMFPPKLGLKILLSTMAEGALLAGLSYLHMTIGHLPVLLWYWAPYVVVNAWLVLYTWLQHTDPSVPHYGEGEWTWVRGALATIDRDYGIFDFFHHQIGSTHVVHHFFHEMPWYHAQEATVAIKAFLEPKGLYNFDPTPWYLEVWRVARTCHYVDSREGIQYYKSLADVPRSKNIAKNKKSE